MIWLSFIVWHTGYTMEEASPSETFLFWEMHTLIMKMMWHEPINIELQWMKKNDAYIILLVDNMAAHSVALHYVTFVFTVAFPPLPMIGPAHSE